MLAQENKRRDAEPRDDSYDNVYINQVNAQGKAVQQKVDRVRVCYERISPHADHLTRIQAFQDLTDMQNQDFRYVL